ncbi:GTPase regulator Rng2-like [Schizosaccharomyces pombe]|uniref:Uncharacterized protein C17D1.07c n=1 Tax=Schizosaccharomyces pombe (strain 972 / ATCC 24843) TaxID=284812 RepID=YBX7_SCHPO|nr:putative GTPase regulator [Schizosaccharomyces pombe]Q10201.2 RecName: Full=Uncharacterized protein C17D1.07c [Schizosaccharomyces pombe 972h-]CAA20431.2 GTPase regulator (predicted) [Schizosaccharomyces pombe]|eukprot:NP_596389.2 putative GTPase regulator [Schizosaccharomyces pombe]
MKMLQNKGPLQELTLNAMAPNGIFQDEPMIQKFENHYVFKKDMKSKRNKEVKNQMNDWLAYGYLCSVHEAKKWLEEETNNEYQNLDDFVDALVNGKVLCQLAFKYYPKLASNWKPRYQISERNTVYLNAFFHFLDFIGMFTPFRFETKDLVRRFNIPKVIYCLHALSYLLDFLEVTRHVPSLYGKLRIKKSQLNTATKEISLLKKAKKFPNFPKLKNFFCSYSHRHETATSNKQVSCFREVPAWIKQCQSQCRGFLTRKCVSIEKLRRDDMSERLGWLPKLETKLSSISDEERLILLKESHQIYRKMVSLHLELLHLPQLEMSLDFCGFSSDDSSIAISSQLVPPILNNLIFKLEESPQIWILIISRFSSDGIDKIDVQNFILLILKFFGFAISASDRRSFLNLIMSCVMVSIQQSSAEVGHSTSDSLISWASRLFTKGFCLQLQSFFEKHLGNVVDKFFLEHLCETTIESDAMRVVTEMLVSCYENRERIPNELPMVLKQIYYSRSESFKPSAIKEFIEYFLCDQLMNCLSVYYSKYFEGKDSKKFTLVKHFMNSLFGRVKLNEQTEIIWHTRNYRIVEALVRKLIHLSTPKIIPVYGGRTLSCTHKDIFDLQNILRYCDERGDFSSFPSFKKLISLLGSPKLFKKHENQILLLESKNEVIHSSLPCSKSSLYQLSLSLCIPLIEGHLRNSLEEILFGVPTELENQKFMSVLRNDKLIKSIHPGSLSGISNSFVNSKHPIEQWQSRLRKILHLFSGRNEDIASLQCVLQFGSSERIHLEDIQNSHRYLCSLKKNNSQKDIHRNPLLSHVFDTNTKSFDTLKTLNYKHAILKKSMGELYKMEMIHECPRQLFGQILVVYLNRERTLLNFYLIENSKTIDEATLQLTDLIQAIKTGIYYLRMFNLPFHVKQLYTWLAPISKYDSEISFNQKKERRKTFLSFERRGKNRKF